MLAQAIAVSLAAAASADSLGEPMVAEFRLETTGRTLQAIAWRRGADVLVAPQTLAELGVTAVEAVAPISLNDIPGLDFTFIESEQAFALTCTAACFQRRRIGAGADAPPPIATPAGAFLNLDLTASAINGRSHAAGAFDLGLANAQGFGGTSWTAGARGDDEVIRLDTSWTIDFPDARLRASFGDAIARSAGLGAPFRFGGVQIGADFSLDPTFITVPTPSFSGEAQTPSIVDLYVNGALRARERIGAGPFELTDAPLVTGGGVARLVVTDALGRQQILDAPFYVSQRLLRPGLSQFALAAGAERLRYALSSADYGRGFVLGDIRRGLTNWATAEARAELSDDFSNLAAAASFAHPRFGQLDLSYAASSGDDGNGSAVSAAWSLQGQRFSLGAEVENATADFRQLGLREQPPALRIRASAGLDLADYGRIAVTHASVRDRPHRRVETLEFTYAASVGAESTLALSALRVDDGEAPFDAVSVIFTRAFGDFGAGALVSDLRDGDASFTARAQRTPTIADGWGWRASLTDGAAERAEFAIAYRGVRYDAQLEAGTTIGADGLRGQFMTSLVWIDHTPRWARPIRNSFALVDAGAPDVAIYHERQFAGRTGRDGRLLVADLRAYEQNRISLELNDLDIGAEVATDEIIVRPAAHSGAIVRFPVNAAARGGEVRIVDASGAPLREGAILVREADGARFAVGRDGRAYVTAAGPATLRYEGGAPCTVRLELAALDAAAALRCEAP